MRRILASDSSARGAILDMCSSVVSTALTFASCSTYLSSLYSKVIYSQSPMAGINIM